MSDLSTSLHSLEAQFAEALATHDDGGNLAFVLFPIDQDVEIGPVQAEGTGPPEALTGATHYASFGLALWTDADGHAHRVLSFVTGAYRFEEPLRAFLRLSRRAGAFCFRLPPGVAQTGPGNAPELNWLGTLYTYLKGTPYVEEGAGFSRLRSVFAASIEVLHRLHGESSSGARVYTGSLRPGLVGVEGGARFVLTPIAPTHSPRPEPQAGNEPQRGQTPNAVRPDGADQTSEPAELRPDEFRFPCGRIVPGFATKQLRLLRLIRPSGKAGMPIDEVCRGLDYPRTEKGRKRLHQLIARTQEKINGNAQYIIETNNGHCCLTAT